MADNKEHTATLHRMVMDKHLCPFGLKSLDLLKRKGYQVDDRHLTSREETDAFKAEHQVDTTPQTFIDGQRIGGYEALRKHFGMAPEKKEGVTYVPVLAIFVSAFAMSLALIWNIRGAPQLIPVLEWFVAITMCVLAIQKLRDLTAFSNQFIVYDLLAMRVVRYAYVYPFAEFYVGVGMLAGLSAWLVYPVALLIGGIGAVSVFKAVYIDKRELKCACVGGNSNVPLGFVSLTENLFMILAAVWMWVR
ncbi:glutaredoxin [Pseudohongiella acticola]|uniref:Methylamine utilization protein MauE n=1 Tax=Pseudohongiella acticola TaxID=1524254 RepID=A0A1E8CK48_9GAMM|nr:glutaredoxin [Pseudohongiella acticola]OFE12783.1 glutaredoxin [Pseudohongiella acticola]